MMYYPFAFASLTAVAQLVTLVVDYWTRICFGPSKMSKLMNGAFKTLTIGMLLLGIYGLSTNIPKNNHNSCFDL